MTVSVLYWLAHAIDEDQIHPSGVLHAERGHCVTTVTVLRETSRGQKPCEACGATVTPGGTAAPP